jgi:TolB-like protein/Tfp pilus assembly protein PilF
MSLYHELKRRNVFRVAIAYLALAWLLTEVSGTLFPAFGIPDWGVRFVVIVFALGFVPALIISWVYELTPEGIKREKDVRRDASTTQLTAKRLDVFTIGLIVVALVFILADRLWLSPKFEQQIMTPAEVVIGTVQTSEPEYQYPPNSIAVLPFVNMSDDASNEYFSDGISEELLNLMAKIPELRVISRSSAFYFKGKDVRLADVARELNVAHILEGSVRKAGNKVRITAQLIEASSDTHLWSETYDRTLDDIFVIQDEIAGSVVDALKLTLLGDAPQSEPTDPEAYALYLQAVHVGAQSSAEDLEQSNGMLKKVLATAPNYARAWRFLARNYAVQAARGLLPRDEGNALAREAITQALAIDPGLAEAHSWFGNFVAEQDGNLVAAAQHIRRGLSLEPNNLIVLAHSSGFLITLGRLDEAIAIQEYHVAHDPLNPIARGNLGWNYLYAGRPDEAIATARTLQMLSPGSVWAHSLQGHALLHKGEYEAALKAIQQEPDELSRLASLVMAYHALGQAVESNAALTELIGKYEHSWPYFIAAVLAYRGEADRAFEWLDKAVAYGDPALSSIAGQTWLSGLFEDSRWLPFLESIGRSTAQLDAIEFEVELPAMTQFPHHSRTRPWADRPRDIKSG